MINERCLVVGQSHTFKPKLQPKTINH